MKVIPQKFAPNSGRPLSSKLKIGKSIVHMLKIYHYETNMFHFKMCEADAHINEHGDLAVVFVCIRFQVFFICVVFLVSCISSFLRKSMESFNLFIAHVKEINEPTCNIIHVPY